MTGSERDMVIEHNMRMRLEHGQQACPNPDDVHFSVAECARMSRRLQELSDHIVALKAKIRAANAIADAYESNRLEVYADYIGRIGAAVRSYRAVRSVAGRMESNSVE